MRFIYLAYFFLGLKNSPSLKLAVRHILRFFFISSDNKTFKSVNNIFRRKTQSNLIGSVSEVIFWEKLFWSKKG